MENRLVDESYFTQAITKPIELYVFIDPTCTECCSLQPTIRKLLVDYEHYFTFRIIIRSSLPKLNLPFISKDVIEERDKNSHASFPSIAIKAAEFQGQKAAYRFISKLFDAFSIHKQDITSFDCLVNIAKELDLDVAEFVRDFSSKHVQRALQIDLFMAKEMDVQEAPSFVFFNENIEDEGLKVSGSYPYEVYEQILQELTGQTIYPAAPPPLECLLGKFDGLSTREIAEIYRIPEKSAERELKKQLLQRQISFHDIDDLRLWKKK